MNRTVNLTRVALLTLTVAVLLPTAAYGYGGPGSVVSGIGAMVAVIFAIGAAIFGFVWFPLKRLAKKVAEMRRKPSVNDNVRLREEPVQK